MSLIQLTFSSGVINSGLLTSARLRLHGKSSQDGGQDLSQLGIRKRQRPNRFLHVWQKILSFCSNSMVFHGFTKLFLSQFYRSYCDESFCEMQCPESHEVDTYACSFYLKQIAMSVYSHHVIALGFFMLFCFGWLFLRSMFSMIRRHPVCKCLAPSHTSMGTFAVIQCEWADEQTG